MLTARDAYNKLISINKDFNIEGAVDYNFQYYIFAGGMEVYSVNKVSGKIAQFSPMMHMDEYFDAVEKRSIPLERLGVRK